MNNFFDQAFEYLIQPGIEGSTFTNDPKDKGGPTRYGVTQHALATYLGRDVTVEEVRDMTPELAKAVYFHDYWIPLSCDRLSKFGTALCIFTSGVLYGIGTAANMAQRSANICGGTLKIDGDIGDMSVATLNVIKQEEFLKAFRSLVLLRINTIIATNPSDEKYRHGWENRADKLLAMNSIVPKNIA